MSQSCSSQGKKPRPLHSSDTAHFRIEHRPFSKSLSRLHLNFRKSTYAMNCTTTCEECAACSCCGPANGVLLRGTHRLPRGGLSFAPNAVTLTRFWTDHGVCAGYCSRWDHLAIRRHQLSEPGLW